MFNLNSIIRPNILALKAYSSARDEYKGSEGIFLDANENEIPLGGIYLKDITKIDISNLDPRLNNIKIEIACDVDNPLCGSNGASYIFGPQKGATSEDILALDHALENFANITEKQFSNDINSIQGAGAAGGMGAAWTGFTNAKLRSGIDIITDIVNLADHAKNADIVLHLDDGNVNIEYKNLS